MILSIRLNLMMKCMAKNALAFALVFPLLAYTRALSSNAPSARRGPGRTESPVPCFHTRSGSGDQNIIPHDRDSSTETNGHQYSERSLSVSRSAFLSAAGGALLTTFLPNPAVAESEYLINRSSCAPKGGKAVYDGKISEVSSTSVTVAKSQKTSETLEESISGFLSGAALAATKTVVKYPLDTATVRLQMPKSSYSIMAIPDLFKGSFRGISGPLISNIPAGAIFFAVKDAAKSALKENGASRWLATSLAVAAALPPYWLVRNPSEVVKTRQQAGVEGYGEGTSLIDAFKVALSTETTDNTSGVGKLYAGYWENLLYALPADLIKFLCYDSLTGGRKGLPPLEGAAYGAFSTAIAQLVTTPLDVVRNRVMAGEDTIRKGGAESGDDNFSQLSYVQAFKDIADEEGVRALFSGASPRVGKAILSGAIQFATYEETKQSISKAFLQGKQ
uniref:Mitochondrial carrier protein n=1 Tax=Odontella aurita TaxID=265563 RepID=A0A7S4N5T8_9STRA|mmetsp:Transcript_481/g.1444  ORF Transcript_481/g.1444 Transcript_481/m.1444 type:complete len:448 (+) Transcript_481:25-1368(+)